MQHDLKMGCIKYLIRSAALKLIFAIPIRPRVNSISKLTILTYSHYELALLILYRFR